MCCGVWREHVRDDVRQSSVGAVARRVVEQQQYVAPCSCHCRVELIDPILEEDRGHPPFRRMHVVEAEISGRCALETAQLAGCANED